MSPTFKLNFALALVVILALTLNVLQAQDFQAFYSNSSYQYELVGVRPVEVNVNSIGDTLLRFANLVRREGVDSHDCFEKDRPFFGDSVQISTNQTVFYAQDGFPLTLKNSMELNDTWTFGNLGDTVELAATVTGIETEEFFNTQLLVATIQLSQAGGTGNYLGLTELKVAQDIGLISFYDFLFPQREIFEVDHEIWGLGRANLGIQHFGFLETYSMPIGTVIHERKSECYDYCKFEDIRVEVLEKSVYNNDSIFFKLDIYKVITEYDNNSNKTVTTESEELTRMVRNTGYLDAYSGEYAAGLWQEPARLFRQSGQRRVEDGYLGWDESCFREFVGLFSDSYEYEMIGSGFLGRYHDNPTEFFNTQSYLPVYYNTGSEEWGTPNDVLTSIHEYNEERFDVAVYPTSSTSIFRFRSDSKESATLEIFSLQGELLYRTNYSGTLEVPVDTRWVGPLIYKVWDGNGKYATGRLIVGR